MKRPRKNAPLLNEPKQRRTRERLEQIFDAAESLFAEKGFALTSMRDIARAVPCSMSAIYDRFGSKDALLLAMHERHYARVVGGIERRAPTGDVDLHDFLPRLVHFALTASRANRGLNRAMLAQATFNPALAAKERELRTVLADLAYRMILQGASQIEHPDPPLAADFAARMIAGVLLQRYDCGTEFEVFPMDDRRFEEETVRACLGYLGVRPRSSKKRTVKKGTAKKGAGKKSAAKKSAAKKSAAKKGAGKKSATKKGTAKKGASRKRRGG